MPFEESVITVAQFFTEYLVPKYHRCGKTLLHTFQSTGRHICSTLCDVTRDM